MRLPRRAFRREVAAAVNFTVQCMAWICVNLSPRENYRSVKQAPSGFASRLQAANA